MQEGQYSSNPTGVIRSTLDFQFQIAWQMLDLHLTGLQDEEFHWRPASKGLHVYRESGTGIWRAEWPFTDKPFHDVVAWLNLELIKNAAEIGYCRFLYAANKP